MFLPTVGGQDAVDVLLDGIVFLHTFFQASVFGAQPILFFGQSGIFRAQLGKVGELITDARRFQRPRRRFKENDFALTSAQILSLSRDFFIRYIAALALCRWRYTLSAAPDQTGSVLMLSA